MPGRDNLSGFTEEHINDYYLCDEYSRRFVVVKTDPPIVVIYDRVKPRTEPLAFAWLYQALSVAGVLDPHFNGLSTDDFSLGAGNFEPLGSFRYEIRGARRARDLVRQVPLDTVEVSDNIYAVIQFLPPSGWGGPSVVSRRVWGTRPCWRRDSSGNPEERYGLSDLRRLCSFGFVDASAGRGENVTREQELSYIRRNIGSKSGGAIFAYDASFLCVIGRDKC
ncbi:MAG: hypothetical protein KatS3mg087_0455 [Patescibacteria group bacterium]|nr:MAG: hypothetical protein KatS3mg087_0455 [Patescibacteria group bacterium]